VEIDRTPGEAVPYITRLTIADPKPAPLVDRPKAPVAPRGQDERTVPTHVLHDGTAYPVTGEPFVIGTALPPGKRGLSLGGTASGLSGVHCSIRRSDRRVIVEDHGSHGSFVNGRRVAGATPVARGDRLSVGTPGVELHFITVTDDDAAPRD
jgi:hypothetical protein